MNWLEITLDTTHDEIPQLSDRLESLGVTGLVINDESVLNDFLENGTEYWDYVDEELIRSMRGVCQIQFYLEDGPDGEKELSRIRAELADRTFTVRCIRDEDWENNWKEYYKPIESGNRLLIMPEWENAPEDTDRTVLRLDPGLIFGTGAHATTRMCLEALEACGGKNVLDLGCGSGILSIAAILLGAEYACGCDIDEKARDIAMENAALNGIDGERLKIYTGDILSDRRLRDKMSDRKYDVILANIVADVIIALAPHVTGWLAPAGRFICSGIIDGRENEVRNALVSNGLDIINEYTIDNWHCFASISKQDGAQKR